jgi:hypothetical protein
MYYYYYPYIKSHASNAESLVGYLLTTDNQPNSLVPKSIESFYKLMIHDAAIQL